MLGADVPGAPIPLSQESIAAFDRIVAVNLRGAFFELRATLAHLRAQGEGGVALRAPPPRRPPQTLKPKPNEA